MGVDLTSASNTALIYAAPPLWGMLLGFALGLEAPRLRGILGVLLAMLGVGIIVYGGLGGGSLPGDLLVSGAALCWGSYTAFSIILLRSYSPLTVAAYTLLFAGLAVLQIAFFDLARTHSGSERRRVGRRRVLRVRRGSLRIPGLATRDLPHRSQQGARLQYLITLTSVISDILLLGESLGANQLPGAIVIFFGVYLGRRQ